jgi:hypothetical protein
MGTVVGQDGGRRTTVNYHETLNKHPVGSNGLPRILMAAFACQYSIRIFLDLVIHRLKPSPLASLLMVFRGLFGLISWSFRLHSKNLTARGVDANFFWRFSTRASQYKRPRSAVLVLSPIPRYGCCRLAP